MTQAITLWLAFILAAATIAWFGPRRQAMAFVVIAALCLPAVFATLGQARVWQPPPGEYTVLGARIDIDEAIWVLIDAQPAPVYHRLPYSAFAAQQLQKAMDGTADGEGTVRLRTSGTGSPGFAEETAPAEPPKSQERAVLG